jgi:hypothetical protein
MIQFPLKIDVYKSGNGWIAEVLDEGIEVHAWGKTKEHALGTVFLSLKNSPGFHLWTFNIVEENEVPSCEIPEVSAHEVELYHINNKVSAIKAYRERTGLSLKQCVEAFKEQLDD